MMKDLNAIVIGAGTDSFHAINEAKKLGFKIIAFDGNPNAEGLRYADRSFVVDLKNPELVIQCLVSHQIVPDIVIPVPIGRYLIASGKVNDYYNLFGVSYTVADYCTDKYKFHTLLAENKLRNIRCELVKQDSIEIHYNFSHNEYPFIVKPRYGSGSRSVFIVNNFDELKEKFINKMPYNEDFLIENSIAGTEYGIDAAVINGVFKLILLREKIVTPYPYRQSVGNYSVIEDENNCVLFKKVNSFMNEIAKVMKLDNILLNADIIYDGNDVFLIEIAARPSGHNLHNLFTPIVTGIDMIGEFIKFAVPRLRQAYTFVPKQVKCMLIRHFDFEDCKVIGVPDEKRLLDKYPLKEFKCNIHNGQFMEKIVDGHTIMTRGYFIVEGNTRQELESVSRNILNEFTLETI